MKKNVIFLLLGLLLIFHSVYSLGSLTQHHNLSIDKLNLTLIIIELLSGGYLFYIFKRSGIKKNMNEPRPSQNGHINLFGLLFGTFVLCAGIYLLYLKLLHNTGNLVVAIFLFLFGLSLLFFTYFQYKKTS